VSFHFLKGETMVIKKIFAACATASIFLPTLTGAQTFEDHTKIRSLSGAPKTSIPQYECAAGTVYSGGQCVLISNHDGDGPQGTFCGAANESIAENGAGLSPIFNANKQPLDTILCKGFNPLYGCPSGYEKAFQFFWGFSNYMATCVKQ
jgi:hypothetical protein